MFNTIRRWQLLVVAAGGWVKRDRQAIIGYLQEENRVLREHLGGKRLRLTDDQRRRLAAKGKTLGRRALKEIVSIVTLDTILRWHRRLIAQKRVGRTSRILGRSASTVLRLVSTQNRNVGFCAK
jgi:hypothetical protein